LVDFKEHFWSFVGAFIGIGTIAFIQSFYFTQVENVFLIGSFGASSVLIFGAIHSPLSKPRNFIGGQFIASIIGVTIATYLPDVLWFTAPLAVASSIVIMQLTKTLHPPAGATALIAIIGTEKIKALGYFYVIAPVMTGTLILFTIALIVNNLTYHRHYPVNSKLSISIKRLFGIKQRIK